MTARMPWFALLTLQLLLLLLVPLAKVSAVPIQLYGLNYNTRKGPDWDWDKCKSRAEILTDLTMLSRLTNRFRILSLRDCGQGELVLSVAKELGLQLWIGLWVAPEEFVFEEEKGELAGLIERGMLDTDTVLGVTVGSEALYREDATITQMIDNLNAGEQENYNECECISLCIVVSHSSSHALLYAFSLWHAERGRDGGHARQHCGCRSQVRRTSRIAIGCQRDHDQYLSILGRDSD